MPAKRHIVGGGRWRERASLERKAAQSEKANQIKFFGAVNDEAPHALSAMRHLLHALQGSVGIRYCATGGSAFWEASVTTRVAGSGLSWVTEHYRLGITSELAVDNLTECLALALEMGDVTHKNLELEIPSYQ